MSLISPCTPGRMLLSAVTDFIGRDYGNSAMENSCLIVIRNNSIGIHQFQIFFYTCIQEGKVIFSIGSCCFPKLKLYTLWITIRFMSQLSESFGSLL